MIYEIKRDNTVIFQHEIKGRRTRSAPAVDFVEIEFDYYEAINLKKNDTIVYKGDTYYCDKQTVNIVKKATNLYTHRAKFLGENYKATEIALLDPEFETHIFEIEGNLLTLVTLAVSNLNRVDSGWSYDATDFPDTITKLFKISDENVMSFIAKLSGEFEIPFVIKDKVIKFLPNLSTEYAGDLSYGRGKGFLNLTKSYKNDKVANTIYASGGEDFQLSHSVEYEPHILENGVIEGFYSNERIFPTTRTQITGVVTQNNVVTTNLISYNLEDYLIQGQRAIVNFETGSLAGLSFFAENVEKIAGVTLIYLQRRTIDGVEYPNDSARPTNSDFFNITNITMPEEIVEEASIKLRDYAVNFLMRSILSNMVIQGEVDPLVINDLQLNDSINITDVNLNLDNQAFYVTETIEHFQDLQKLEIKLEIYIEDNPNLLNLNLDIVNENIIDLQIGSNYDLLVGISDRVIVGDGKNIIKPGFSLIDSKGNDYHFADASVRIGVTSGWSSYFGSIGASWGKTSLSANPDVDSVIKLPQTGSLLPKTLTTSYVFNKTTYDTHDSGVMDLTPIYNAINDIPIANNGSINYVGVGNIVGGGVSNANQSISTNYQFDLTAETKNNIAKAVTALQEGDLDGFIYDVQYNSATHTITFYQQNEPNIVIDLPIEQLIKGVQLVGDDLVFTFEDGSTVTVPLNTLLVGVVKSVNGKTPSSQGEVVINITDIPNLSSVLDGKANASGNNLTNIGTWQSNLNVLTTNTNQTGLTGNKTTSGIWTFNSQINTANHGNSSQWKQAYDWGDFRDYGLGTTMTNSNNPNSWNWDNINVNSIHRGYDHGITGISDNIYGISLINSPTSKYGMNIAARFNNRFFMQGKAPANTFPWVEFYHSGNFNPAQYVLQSSLNTQLANYVPINGVTTINNTKTFTSSPIVPNATLDSHAVNLGQLNSVLDGNYLPLAGGTMNNGSVINWNSGTDAIIQQGGKNRIKVSFSNTFISSSVSGTTDGIYLRPRGDINGTGEVRINGNGQITTHSHGNSSQWHSAYQAIQNLSSTYVPINGVTTINNTKTFTSSPVVPNGTLAGHAVNLGQLNSALAAESIATSFYTMNTTSSVPNTNTNKIIQCNVASSITITLPSGQFNGQKLTFSISSTVSGGGVKISGSLRLKGSNISITDNISLGGLDLYWNATTNTWWIMYVV